MAEKKEQKQIINLKTGTILLTTIIIVIPLSFLLFYIYRTPPSFFVYFLSLIIGSIVSGLITLVILGLIYEKWTKENFIKETKNIFLNEILFNKDIIKKLNNEEVNSGVLECMKVVIGNKMGGVIFKEFLEPYLLNNFSWRTDHNYEVSFSEDSDFCFHNLELSNENYRTTKQHLHYKKTSNRPMENKISIVFCFDYKSLNFIESKENIFFREYIPLTHLDRKKLFILFNKRENINDFINIVLNLDVYKHPCNEKYSKIKGKLLQKKLVEKREHNNIPYIYIEYDINNIKSNDKISEESFFLGLSFRMPYERTATNFLITIPELTNSPTIHFTYSEKMKNLQYYSFNDYKPNDKNDYSTDYNDNLISYSPEKWIFPVSGMTIIWSN